MVPFLLTSGRTAHPTVHEAASRNPVQPAPCSAGIARSSCAANPQQESIRHEQALARASFPVENSPTRQLPPVFPPAPTSKTHLTPAIRHHPRHSNPITRKFRLRFCSPPGFITRRHRTSLSSLASVARRPMQPLSITLSVKFPELINQQDTPGNRLAHLRVTGHNLSLL